MEHKTHIRDSLQTNKKSTELIKLSFKNFLVKINEDIDEVIPDYNTKITHVQDQIKSFFNDQIAKIEEQTKLLIGTCNNYANRITILIKNNSNKFVEKIGTTNDMYTDMREKIGQRIIINNNYIY